MRLVTSLASVGVAAVLAGALLVVPGSSSAARRDPVEVVPSALPVGATPTIAWYRSATGEIVWPGHRPVKISVRKHTGPLLNARGGWLRDNGEGTITSFVDTHGKTRRLGPKHPAPRFPWNFQGQLVARDGRTFVDRAERYTKRTFSTTVRVRRTRDGKVLRQRTFRESGVQVRAATSSVVALKVVHEGARHEVDSTEYWDQRTGRLRVFRSHKGPPSLGFGGFYRSQATSLSHHLIADGKAVRDSRTGRVLWRTSGDESPDRFSPDGTRVVTFADDLWYTDGFTPRLMRIRDARTGAVLATFHGLFTNQVDEDPKQGPFWESKSSLLVLAYEAVAWNPDLDETAATGAAWIRCTTAGSCERVPIDPATDHVTIPRSG